MPFLKFSRDRRGYETTVLMHAFREGGRSIPRILYWFRSPVAAKIGRPAIDEEAIRLIEERYRGVPFDWAKILQSRAVVDAERAEPPGGGDDRPRRQRSRRKRGQEPADHAAVSDAQTPAARAAEEAEAPRATAAEEFFTVEDLTRLRGRHAAILARIDREVPDSAAATGLREAAETLNPDTWVTRGDVDAALEHYELNYRRLLDSLGPPRKRVAAAEAEMPARSVPGGGDDAG